MGADQQESLCTLIWIRLTSFIEGSVWLLSLHGPSGQWMIVFRCSLMRLGHCECLHRFLRGNRLKYSTFEWVTFQCRCLKTQLWVFLHTFWDKPWPKTHSYDPSNQDSSSLSLPSISSILYASPSHSYNETINLNQLLLASILDLAKCNLFWVHAHIPEIQVLDHIVNVRV